MTLRRRLLKLLVLLALLAALYPLWHLGLALRLQTHNPEHSAYMSRAEAQGKVRHEWRDYEQISDYLKRAVLISEDAQFTRHGGFDWAGIRYALKRNLEAGEPVAGGSTITQQLAKNLYLSGDRSYLRKGKEAIIALMLETGLSKRRILELYLNLAQWGHQIYGAEAAAQHYFSVSAAELSPQQAAQLAAMLPRPNQYDFRGPTDYVSERADWIVGQMRLVAIPDPTEVPLPPLSIPPGKESQSTATTEGDEPATTAPDGAPATATEPATAPDNTPDIEQAEPEQGTPQ
ncbi:MAG: monofunctional biosynthetic peptidoglycan transglycosylase [Pseudomonadota bacterium]|uniref:monofunctional biosynthetic peptidoglycan transglycosylase n=1 Tax=Alcanivorax sp. TaxID=1872427 RepID=UPI00243C4B22|nr:monofunctional biosynthetic peptidoglycan transglycosylase [Alcanivorax sp.]MEE3322061.1 monofunctional biosynthetic peptidoglycan transglycosylase [Pseudomonadota bacterium]